MTNFFDMFAFEPGAGGVTEPDEYVQPEWLGPPGEELGACVPLSVVVGRSDSAVVAVKHATAYSTGVALAFVAAARGLRDRDANRLFHEQHVIGPDDELPDAFLRIGIEFADGSRVSNLDGRRHLWRPDQQPEGPLLMQHGGGGGSAGGGRVTLQPDYWLWPLPPPGSLRVFVEWPALGIPLVSAELDSTAVLEAAARSTRLW